MVIRVKVNMTNWEDTERIPLTDEYPLCATHDPGGYHDEDDYVTNSQSPTQ